MEYNMNHNYFITQKLIGTTAEIAVRECIKAQYPTIGLKHAVPTLTPHATHDIEINDIDRFTVEVKSARNGGKFPNLFAEIIQYPSCGYAEYLVHIPDYIVYVDIDSDVHYWYDGQMFAQAVKRRFDLRKDIAHGTASGITFPKDSINFGFICAYRATGPHTMDMIKKYHGKEIKDIQPLKQSAPVYKSCTGLPTLK
jgi:hypothetical protein